MSFKHLSFALLLLFAVDSLAQLPSASKDPVDELRARWLAARARALKPLDDAYVKQLQEMKVAETKKGNLEGALRVAAEIKEVTAENAIDDVSHADGDAIRKALENSMWLGQPGGSIPGWTVQLGARGNMSLTHADGTAGWGGWTWKIADDGKMTIGIPNVAKPIDAVVSKRLDRMTFPFAGGCTLKRIVTPAAKP
jgi:hypothetical protein